MKADPMPGPPRFLAWLAVLVLTLYLVLIGGAWAGIYSAELRVTTLTLAGSALGAWFLVAIRRPKWRPWSALSWGIAAALAALAIATVLSRVRPISVEYLAWAVVLALLYFLLVRLLAHPFFGPRLLTLAVLLCALIGSAYVVAVLGRWIEWWSLVERPAPPPFRPLFESLTYGNPSAVLTMCVLLFATAAAHLGVTGRGRRVVLVVIGALTLFAIVVSGSRAGWLAVAVAVPVTAILIAAPVANRARARDVARRARGWAALAVVPAVVLAIVAAPAIFNRLGAGGDQLRATYLLTSLRMWLESPIVGTGPGSWVPQRIKYTATNEPDYYIPHAHNVYVQTLAELGIVGAIAGVVVVAGVVALIVAALRATDPRRRRFGYAAAFATSYFAVHNLLDFYANMPAVLFAFALPIAYLDATLLAARARHLAPATRRWSFVGLGVAGLAAMLVLARAEAVALDVSSAVAHANRGDWSRAHGVLAHRRGDRLDLPSYELTRGLILAREGDHAGAADAFRLAATADDLPESWLNLAAQASALGEEAVVTEGLARAFRLGSERPGIALGVGYLALRHGDDELALAAFTRALARAPTLAGDTWWRREPTRRATFEKAVRAAISQSDPNRALVIALAAGQGHDARAALAQLPAEGQPAAEHLIDAWNGEGSASEALISLARDRPIDGPVAAAAIALAHNNDPRASDFQKWADIRYAGIDPDAYIVRVARSGERDYLPVSLASFYGHYTYRRPTPWDLLVPSLPHLRLEVAE